MLQEAVKNRTFFCRDNLDVLQGINNDSVDLIYLDPPFNKKKIFTAPIGSSAEGASFRDYFREEDVKDEWVQSIKEDDEKLYNFLENVKILNGRKSYNFCYLTYMAIRLMECHRILKDTGSVYLHCDPTMSHYLKILLDIVFGENNFRNEIVWCYKSRPQPKKNFAKKHDVILFYSKTDDYFFDRGNSMRPLSESTIKKYKLMDKDGRKYRLQGRGIQDSPIKSAKDVDEQWEKTHPELTIRDYLDEKSGVILEDWWNVDIINQASKERTGYPTQKPLMLLERIIKTSSNPGDMVLDPFCGCATTCVAAEKLGRQWIGVDVSQMAYDLVRERLNKEVADSENLLQYQNKIHFTTTPPQRSDIDKETGEKKYIYVISNKKYKNEYKVGIAGNLQSRLNSYQTADPNRGYKLEFSLLVSNYRELEKFIHNNFDSRHEWVRGELGEIVEMIKN